MYRAFWDTIFLLSGYLFTYSQVQDNSTSTTTMAITPTTITATNMTAVSSTTVKRKFLVAAVHSHFADCPDSHSHFCFHGTCRFLILEETPACVCCPVQMNFMAPCALWYLQFFGDCSLGGIGLVDVHKYLRCHPGFIGMRCEHADLLAVVATNQRQQTLATMLMLCILGSVLIALLCTIINCWWRRGRCRREPLLCCLSKKPSVIIKSGTPCCHLESVV